MGEIATCPPNLRWLEPATPDFSGLPPAEELLEVIEAFLPLALGFFDYLICAVVMWALYDLKKINVL